MKVGYSFWGYLGDIKFDTDGHAASTPDGNAFYSWSIINELQARGHEVYLMMPDRDMVGSCVLGNDILFQSWASDKRKAAYLNSITTLGVNDVNKLSEFDVFMAWDEECCGGLDVILHEWRMDIPGRNTEDARFEYGWQPDLFIQRCLLKYCALHGIKLVLFDLDYKLSESDVESIKEMGIDVTVFELGDKWNDKPWARRVCIPFDFTSIYEFKPKSWVTDRLVYVGNRYERDWCIDKYIPRDMDGVAVYGNWDEGGRDSKEKWPDIDFRHRLQTCEMRKVYSSSASTILLAKRDYCEHHFMTARLIESVFYCSVPLFIEEYGEDTIKKFAGGNAKWLTVHSADDVARRANELYDSYAMRVTIINNLREHLKKFMDVTMFVDELLSV